MFQRGILIILCLVILVMSWEGSLEASSIIPDESIRIRILANSDSISDQWIKRQVRDAIIAETKSWVGSLASVELHSAREIIKSRIPDIQRVAEQTLQKYGFSYGVKVELGMVEFPKKQFGNRFYPENQYEALRIILGNGEGANWWCVLFPPLCFIDGMTEPISYPQGVVDKKGDSKNNSSKSNKTTTNGEKTANQQPIDEKKADKIKPKFFLVELWQSLF